MENTYYRFAFAIIAIVVLGAVVLGNKSKLPPVADNEVLNATSTTATTTVASTISTTSTPVKATASNEPEPARTSAQYYPIDSYYLTTDSSVYYKPSNTVAQMIKVVNPPLHSSLSSPLVVDGSAIGTWYSADGTFPIILTDKNGLIIAQGTAQALANWKNFDMVSFSGTLVFVHQISQSSGVLILKKSNSSGLASNDASIEIAVQFQ